MPNAKKKTDPEPSRWLLIWWMQKNPYASIVENQITMEACANVRNALVIKFRGEILEVKDWYRRSHERCNHKTDKEAESCGDGDPMPSEWRDLVAMTGPVPWLRPGHIGPNHGME